MSTDLSYHNRVPQLAADDAAIVLAADTQYQGSWQQRGGTGAFFTIARKWDRIEAAAKRVGYDLEVASRQDDRPEGLINDIRDLRRYLTLLEAWLVSRGSATSRLTEHEQDQLEQGLKLVAEFRRRSSDMKEVPSYALAGSKPLPLVGSDVSIRDQHSGRRPATGD